MSKAIKEAEFLARWAEWKTREDNEAFYQLLLGSKMQWFYTKVISACGQIAADSNFTLSLEQCLERLVGRWK